MATYSKTLVLLANSCKHGGRCVAGKEVLNGKVGGWIRPTSHHANGELYVRDQQLAGGGQPAVLDVVEVPFARPAPSGFQTENHRLAPGRDWLKRGRLPWAAVALAVDDCDQLWLDGYSSAGGCNDRVPAERLGELAGSLLFIGPLRMDLHVLGTRVRGRFVYRQTVYNLSVTDPWIKAAYARLPDGWYRLDRVFVCLSLAPVFHGYAYKLAAAILRPNTD
jgi:hypothetical protein